MNFSRNGLILVGAILALAGIVALGMPRFTTSETKEVARIGDLKIQATEDKSYVIPPFVSGGVLLLGVVLIGAGMMTRRA